MNQLFEMLLSRGYSPTNKAHGRIGFDDVLEAFKSPGSHYLINTLPITEQDCLIQKTINAFTEENIINDICSNYDMKKKTILLYGKNTLDLPLLQEKQAKLASLGFNTIYIYVGGLFEWMLLQDIYGVEHFPTTKRELDIIKFRPPSVL